MSNALEYYKYVMCTINGMTFRAPPCIFITYQINMLNELCIVLLFGHFPYLYPTSYFKAYVGDDGI